MVLRVKPTPRRTLRLCGLHILLCPIFVIFSSVLYAGDVESIAEEDWLLVETPHFRVFSDSGERYANAFAVDLESFSRALPTFVSSSLKENISKLNVFALKDSSNLKILINSKDTAGLFITDKVDNYAIANLRYYRFNRGKQNFARQVLFHEYVHFYVANSHAAARTPVWYSEGLADFLSTILIDDDEVSYGHVHEGRMRSLNPAKSVPIKKLFEAAEYPESRREKSNFYNYAWFVYHYLFTHPEFSAKNRDYLKLLNSGFETKVAFEKGYGMQYEDFGKVIKKYFGDRFNTYTLTLKEPWDLGLEKAVKLSPGQISYELGRLMLARRSSDEEVFRANRSLGYGLIEYSVAQDPNNVSAQLELWNRGLEMGAREGNGQLEELGKQITLMMDRYPKHSGIAKHVGDWLSSQVEFSLEAMDHDEARSLAVQARGKYRRALALDSSNKYAYLALGELYRRHNRYLLNSDQEKGEYEAVLRELFYITSYRDYQYSLALFLEKFDRKDEAIEEYRMLEKGGNTRLVKLAKARLAALGG